MSAELASIIKPLDNAEGYLWGVYREQGKAPLVAASCNTEAEASEQRDLWLATMAKTGSAQAATDRVMQERVRAGGSPTPKLSCQTACESVGEAAA